MLIPPYKPRKNFSYSFQSSSFIDVPMWKFHFKSFYQHFNVFFCEIIGLRIDNLIVSKEIKFYYTGILVLLLALASASFCFLLAAALLALSFGSSGSSLISIVSMKSLHIIFNYLKKLSKQEETSINLPKMFREILSRFYFLFNRHY